MPHPIRLLAFHGSLRRASLNGRLLELAAQEAERAGASVTRLALGELALPLYDPNLEEQEGFPSGAIQLKQAMATHDGFLVASPEHNACVTAVLKNSFDWASRALPGERRFASLAGRPAALLAASPGPLGGARSLTALRAILQELEVLAIPEQVVLPRAQAAFSPDGALLDERATAAVRRVVARLIEVATRLRATPPA
ncbi:MAG: NAD(P)H-dependent oxidoreductase [Holophagales bacterium]|nr:MAG: NAD(P)H-dependent oxidoreductase [Holophagales bacterium]